MVLMVASYVWIVLVEVRFLMTLWACGVNGNIVLSGSTVLGSIPNKPTALVA